MLIVEAGRAPALSGTSESWEQDVTSTGSSDLLRPARSGCRLSGSNAGEGPPSGRFGPPEVAIWAYASSGAQGLVGSGQSRRRMQKTYHRNLSCL